jgi:HD-like signal output (HDOD) protein
VGRVKVGNLKAGMVLASDLKAPNGRFILAKGAVLIDKHTKMMKVWGVAEADIEGTDDAEVQERIRVDEEAARKGGEIASLLLLPGDGEHGCLTELRRICALRFTERLAAGTPGSFPELDELNAIRSGERGWKPDPVIPHEGISPEYLLRQDVRLVSFPDIYFKIREVLNSPVSSATHIAQVVSKDPSLTVRLLRLVNSSFYGFPNPITSIPRAVAIIGTNELTSLALAVSTISVFKHVPPQMVDMKSFWKHSIACGIFSRLLAFSRRHPSEERFFLAGLLHDLGRIIMLTRLPQVMTSLMEHARSRRVPLVESERTFLGYDHATLGNRLLEHWNIPEPIRDLVRRHHIPSESGPADSASEPSTRDAALVHLGDVVANALRIGTSGSFFVPAPENAAWDLLELTPPALDSIVRQGERQIREIMNVFLVF